jgi:hypothetical protein
MFTERGLQYLFCKYLQYRMCSTVQYRGHIATGSHFTDQFDKILEFDLIPSETRSSI